MNSDNVKNAKVNILAIVPTSFCYGLQHITLDFFTKMKGDVNAHFLVTRWNDGEFVKELNKRQIPYSFSWMGMFSRKLDWPNLKMSLNCLIKIPWLYWNVIVLSKRNRPDILYFANHHELILLYPLLLFMRIPVICHMHDPSPAIPFQKMTFRFYNKVIHRFIAISYDVKKRTELLGCRADKIDVIQNGIKLRHDVISTRRDDFIKLFDWPADSFIIGLTGQMTATKGHEDVINAIAQVNETNPNVRLVIGGKRIDPYYSQLVSLINESGLSGKVMFSGWQEDVKDFFENIDLFVLASRHDEGYGLVVAEAMSFAKPVISTASGGVVEIIEDGFTGIIVPKMSPLQMAEKIKVLVNDPGMNKNMGLESRKRVEVLFDFNKKTEELKEYFLKYRKEE